MGWRAGRRRDWIRNENPKFEIQNPKDLARGGRTCFPGRVFCRPCRGFYRFRGGSHG